MQQLLKNPHSKNLSGGGRHKHERAEPKK